LWEEEAGNGGCGASHCNVPLDEEGRLLKEYYIVTSSPRLGRYGGVTRFEVVVRLFLLLLLQGPSDLQIHCHTLQGSRTAPFVAGVHSPPVMFLSWAVPIRRTGAAGDVQATTRDWIEMFAPLNPISGFARMHLTKARLLIRRTVMMTPTWEPPCRWLAWLFAGTLAERAVVSELIDI
jgi:hypothetical protein